MMGTPQKIAVVVKGWPRLSESFIAQEVLALERLGLDIDLYSLRHPTDKAVSAFHGRIRARATYLPEYLRDDPGRVWRARRVARRLPGYAATRKKFVYDLLRDPTPNRLRRFGQALVLAAELPEDTAHIHAHFLHTPCSVARYAAVMRQLPFSFSAHAKDIWTTKNWEKTAKIADAAFGVTCTREGLADLQRCATGADPAKLHLVYHGLDPDRFPAPKTASALKALPVRILSVGRLVPKKGFDILLQALALLPDDLDWRWTHYGAGPEAAKLSRLAAQLGLEDRITWCGAAPQEELLDAYRSHHLFVLPSRRAQNRDQDGLPNVLLEAQSQGMACIASDIGGIPELIIPGENGLLVLPENPEAVSGAIKRLVDDATFRQGLGAAAQRRVEEHFLLPAHIGRLAALFGATAQQPARQNEAAA